MTSRLPETASVDLRSESEEPMQNRINITVNGVPVNDSGKPGGVLGEYASSPLR